MQSATKMRHESNAAYQISPKPILHTNGYAKKEVGSRGGAYSYELMSASDEFGFDCNLVNSSAQHHSRAPPSSRAQPYSRAPPYSQAHLTPFAYCLSIAYAL